MSDTKSVGRLMQGAIDFHVLADPDPYHSRRLDVLDLALQAKEAGMKAVVAKCHPYNTAPLAYLVNKIVSGFILVGRERKEFEIWPKKQLGNGNFLTLRA